MNYLAKFPEELFPAKNREIYTRRIIDGERYILNKSVLIAGICRNVENIIPLTISRMESIGDMFGDYSVFVYENDSVDKTKDYLVDWHKKNKRVTIMSDRISEEWHNKGNTPQRLSAMSNARNKYVDFYNKTGPYDFLIVVDMDLPGGFSYDGILNSFGFIQESGCSFVGSNGLLFRNGDNGLEKIYYDTFAHRDADNEEHKSELNLLDLQRGDEPYEVDSCFGGLGIYTSFPVKYKDWDCDHVTAHNQMKKLGHKIYINPSMITLYSDTEYSNLITNNPYLTNN